MNAMVNKNGCVTDEEWYGRTWPYLIYVYNLRATVGALKAQEPLPFLEWLKQRDCG